MSDYSISARLKIDDRDVTRVRRDFWLLGSDVRGLARGIKATLGDAFRGLATEIRRTRNATRSATTEMANDFAKVSKAAFREMRMADRVMFASSARAKANARSAVDDLLSAERRLDRSMRALIRPAPRMPPPLGGAAEPAAGGGGLGFGALIGGNILSGIALRAFDAFVSGIGRVMGAIQDAANDAFDFSKRLEVSRVGIASLYVAGGTETGAAMGRSAATIRDLRRQAAEGIGGLEDYIKAYETLYTPLTQAGRSEADVKRFTRLTIAAGGAMEGRLGIRTAPIDVIQALGKGATDAQTRILSSVIRGGGMSLDKFNEMDTAKKLDFLAMALEKWEPAAKMMGKTIESLEDTRKDWLYLFGGEAVHSAGEDYRRSLEAQIGALKDNENALVGFSRTVGVTYAALAGIKNDIVTGATNFVVEQAKNAKTQWYWYERAGGGAEQLRIRLDQARDSFSFLNDAAAQLGGAFVSVGTRMAATAIRFTTIGLNPYSFGSDLYDIWNAGPKFNMEADVASAGDPMGTGEMLAYDGPRLDRLGAAIGSAVGKHKQPLKIEVRAAVDWGDPRSLALSVESMLQDVAHRSAAYALSSDALPAFAGSN